MNYKIVQQTIQSEMQRNQEGNNVRNDTWQQKCEEIDQQQTGV